MAGLAAQFGLQPGAGEFPVPHHGFRRDFQDGGRLSHAKAAEEAQFDDASLACVDQGQRVESVFKSNQLLRPISAEVGQVVQV